MSDSLTRPMPGSLPGSLTTAPTLAVSRPATPSSRPVPLETTHPRGRGWLLALGLIAVLWIIREIAFARDLRTADPTRPVDLPDL